MSTPKPKMSIVRDGQGRCVLYFDESFGQEAVVTRFGPRYQQKVINGGPITIYFDTEVRSFRISPAIFKPYLSSNPRFEHIADLKDLNAAEEDGEEECEHDVEDSDGDEDGSDALGTEKMGLTETSPSSVGASQAHEKIPRPPNSWILFRKDKSKELRNVNPRMSAGEVSTEAARQWKALPDELKEYYRTLAAQAAVQHKIKYPDYRYSPSRK